MLNSLYARLVALILGVLVLVGLVQIALMAHAAELYSEEVTQEVNHSVARQIATRGEILRGDVFDRDQLKRLFSQLMTTHPSVEVYALDPAGTILAFSAPPDVVVRKAVSLDPVQRFLGGARLPITGDDPRATNGRKIFSVAPVRSSAGVQKLAGYIYVILEGQPYQSAAQRVRGSYILQQSVLMAVGALVLALLVAAYLLRGLTHRLRRLATGMQVFADGGFASAPSVGAQRSKRGDEIERLEGAFEVMAACIADQVERIRGADNARRELFANVSHDLRTPLASMRGYLDTVLLKDKSLSESERREFLVIAARHGENLGQLIDDLFELARLDSPQLRLNPEPAAMAELVQDSLQKLELAARKKGVRISGHLQQDLPNVSVDIRLMTRAIDNLFENALRFTAAGRSVVASVVERAGHIAVEVADEGCGIREADLPHVFERFYQAHTGDSAVDRPRQSGLGLGLAIAKQIVSLHGATLSVVTEVNVGTRFQFELRPGVAAADRGAVPES